METQATHDVLPILWEATQRGAQTKADATPLRCPGCGWPLTRCAPGHARTFQSRFGDLTRLRTRGYSQHCSQWRVPTDAALGLEDTAGYSPAVQAMAVLAASKMPVADASLVPKQLYLSELRPSARALLRQGRLPADLAAHEANLAGPCPFRAPELDSLLERFRVLRDPRRGHGLRHRQPFVLACAAVATLMGAICYQAFEDTCKKFTHRQLKALGCRADAKGHHAPPGDSTSYRVLTRLDAAHFETTVGAWPL
jgi:hypothetical protein